MTNAFNIPTKETRYSQIVQPVKIKDLLLTQPLGEAKTTGTATTITKDTAIKAKSKAWKVNKSIIRNISKSSTFKPNYKFLKFFLNWIYKIILLKSKLLLLLKVF